ncbi:MAG: DUF2147 domain-containing protein [Microscillaceae bacterium]|nr:DUF2147 domain-containing protein [Microscillaceae bacterium]MDW8461894.1 DUF2147 domain-containing protein [Cytophagales bacterium]
MKKTVSFLALPTFFWLSCFLFAFAQDDGRAIVGLWLPSNGKARINIYETKTGKFAGKIVWLKEPIDPNTGKPKVDKNNPDKEKQNQPLMGLVLLKGFVYKGNNTWEDGTIYDPESGSTYNCIIKMPDKNTLDVRGYIGVSLFGRTDTWTRLQLKK